MERHGMRRRMSDHFASIANALSLRYRLERTLQSGMAAQTAEDIWRMSLRSTAREPGEHDESERTCQNNSVAA